MMSIKERIEKGRDFAYGISQPIDIEIAYELWEGYEEYLSAEDLETFNIIKNVLFGDDTEEVKLFSGADFAPVNPQYAKLLAEWSGFEALGGGASAANSTKIAKKYTDCTKGQVEELFMKILNIAASKQKLGSLYTALQRCEKKITETSASIEEKDNRFGNNVRYFIHSIFGSLTLFFDCLEKNKDAMKYKPKKFSKASVYMVTSGRNGMDELNLLATIELGTMVARRRLSREVRMEDFYLNCDEFQKLILKRA